MDDLPRDDGLTARTDFAETKKAPAPPGPFQLGRLPQSRHAAAYLGDEPHTVRQTQQTSRTGEHGDEHARVEQPPWQVTEPSGGQPCARFVLYYSRDVARAGHAMACANRRGQPPS